MTRPEWVEAGRAVVIAENGACERRSIGWCDHHESRIRKGMSVCDVFVDYLGLMEEVIAAVGPLIRADERGSGFDEWVERIWTQATEAATAHAEAVAARLVEVICEQESLIIWNIRWREQAEAEKGHLRDQIDGVAELLHRQRVQHAALIAPTHPTAPVLIEVDRILALIGGGEFDD